MENIQEIDIIITLVVGTLVVLIMTVAIVASVIKYQKNILKQKDLLRETEKKFQNDLLDATIIASEKEREVVAKNIHDDLGALINVIKLNNGQIKNNLKNEVLSQELIKTNNQILLEINESIRAILHDLASPTLVKFGFIKAMEQLCSQIPNTVKVDIKANEEDLRFDKKTEIQLYRTCKEVLTNILKHSNAKEIGININFVQNHLSILINYDGNGINDEDVKHILKTSKGLGLKSIFSRIQIMGGLIQYFKDDNNSASVTIDIPILKEADAQQN